MPLTNGRVLFNSIPEGFPEPGKTVVYDESEKIDVGTIPLEGGFLVKTLYLSIDPYMRGRMAAFVKKSNAWPFTLGEPITGYGVGVVLRTENPEVKVGDHVFGFFNFQHFNIFKGLSNAGLGPVIIKNKEKIPLSAYLGVLGMAGQAAYMAWKEYSKAKEGETVFVSGGASAVGSFVVQLAKKQGLKVIASAGSEEKVDYLKSLGTDVAFNYKTTDTADVLEKNGPIDVYWDNVGGETLDAALQAASMGARFIECGMISGYNTSTKAPIKNLFQVIGKSISIHGFTTGVLFPKYEKEFFETVPGLVASGEVKYREHIYDGLESVGEALLAIQKGTNTAKAVVRVAEE